MNNLTQEELNRFRDCPFCGEQPSVTKYDDGTYECYCGNCNIPSTGRGTYTAIANRWNDIEPFTPEDLRVEQYYIELLRKELHKSKFSAYREPQSLTLTTIYEGCRQTLTVDLTPPQA